MAKGGNTTKNKTSKKTRGGQNGSTSNGYRAGLSFWILVGIVAVAILVLGYEKIGTPPHTSPGNNSAPIIQKAPARGFSWKYEAYAIRNGKSSHLIRGHKITIVMLMASWCLYCAYDDRYVWPTIIRTPGLTLNIVDVSPRSGIGNPGPKVPAFTGHDNVGPAVGVHGMRQTMTTYVRHFGLTDANVHVFVDPQGMSYFHIKFFPTILFFNGKGQLVGRVNGGLTAAQAQQIVHQIAPN